MHQYFSHTSNGLALKRDDDGHFLSDIAVAKIEAIVVAKELIADGLYRSIGLDHGEIEVRCSMTSNPDFVISFGEVFSGLRS